MKDKLFNFLKGIYKKMPINYKTKTKLKGAFYRVFGFLFKNTTSYRVWTAANMKTQRNDVIKPDEAQITKYHCVMKVAVQLHLYYIDLLEEFAGYFNNIPFEFDLMVSIADKKQREYVKQSFEKVKHVSNVYVEVVGNRGRDVAPLLCTFGSRIRNYDIICHIHSKKSLYTGGEQTGWRQYLLDGLMGSEETVRSNLYLLEKGEKVGMIYPETFVHLPYCGHTWLQNKGSRDELLHRIGVEAVSDRIYIDYPLGTMFWARVDAIKQFFDADIKTEEFPKEAGQTDGTIAHAFERCLGFVCQYNGFNMLILDEKEKTYAYNYGMKNLSQYFIKSYDNLKAEMSSYDIVSFDIFDTLISRKISDHHAIQRLVELKTDVLYGEKSDFFSLRNEAENSIRNRFPDKDCDIDDIYAELVKISGWSRQKAEKVKNIEIETELSLVAPKSDMIEVLKYAGRLPDKKVCLISDMQLRRTDIEMMLQKCGVDKSDYDELLLSSEMNLRKDNGTMWQYFSEANRDKKCIHIGDNEVSDVQIPGDYEVANYHVMCNKALFQLSNLGKAMGEFENKRAADSVSIGLILNALFSEPFKYNASGLNVRLSDARLTGYCFFGPVVLDYLLWLVEEAKQLNAKKILFFAREGYIFKRVFDALQESCGEDKTEGEYLYVSRRALTFAAIRDYADLENPLDIYYEGKLDNLLRKRFGIELSEVPDEDIKLPDNKKRVLAFLEPYKDRILMEATEERKNYMAYLNRVLSGTGEKERVVVSDIGYSGSIQYFLSIISKRTYDGRYMATDEKKKPLEIEGNTIQGYYIDGDAEQEISKSNIHRYHLLFESVLIARDGQLVKMDENVNPVFEEEENPLYDSVISEIHEGIVEYARDYAELMGTALWKERPGKEISERMTYAMINADVIGDNVANSLLVDDKYCSGEVRKVLEHYRK